VNVFYSIFFGGLKFIKMANKLNNVTTTVNEIMQTDKIDLQLFSNSMPMISVPTYLMIARAKITVDPAIMKMNDEKSIEISTTDRL